MRQVSPLTRTPESSEWRVEGARYECGTNAAKLARRIEHKSCT